MPIFFLCLMILISMEIACAPSSGHQHAVRNRQEEDKTIREEKVYAVLLNDVYLRDDTKLLTIAEDTSLEWLTAEQIKKDLAFVHRRRGMEIEDDIVEDLLFRNKQSSRLTGRLQVKVDCLMLTKNEVAGIGQNAEHWKEFLKKYPGQSIITLSRVGFSRDLSKALVYTGDQSGGRTGKGQYVFLSQENGRWILKHKVLAWES